MSSIARSCSRILPRFLPMLGVVLCLGFATPHEGSAAEHEFPAQNCAITPPEGWEVVQDPPPQPGLVGMFRRPDKNAILFLLVDDKNKPSRPMDEKSAAEFESGVEKSGGGKKLSSKFVEVSGIRAYERTGGVTIQGKPVSTAMLTVAADGKYYSAQAMVFGGDVNKEPEIFPALESFRFLKPPSLPSGPANADSAAYRTGYLVGKSIPAIAVGVIIFLVIRGIFSRRSKRQGPPPPPFPQTRG